MAKVCYLDECYDDCVLNDNAYAPNDCNVAIVLTAEGKGTDDCKHWKEEPIEPQSEIDQLRAEISRLTSLCANYREALGRVADFHYDGYRNGFMAASDIQKIAKAALQAGKEGDRE